MKQLLNDLYWKVLEDMEKLKKSEMRLSERLAYERAVTHLNQIKAILNITTVTLP